MDMKIIAGLLGEELSKKIIYYDVTDSTNTRLRQLARDGAPEGTAVLADCQTAGRGRLGRDFVSGAGKGIYASFLLRPDCTTDAALSLTACAAVAVCRALSRFGIEAEIKWVNDVILGGRKLCGILCESVTGSGGKMQCAVIGIGINVLNRDFPPALRDIAGSVLTQSGRELSREALFAAVYRELMLLYGEWCSDRSCCLAEYRARSAVTGRKVRVLSPQGEYTATALEIDGSYRLTVLSPGGVHTLNGDEIKLFL